MLINPYERDSAFSDFYSVFVSDSYDAGIIISVWREEDFKPVVSYLYYALNKDNTSLIDANQYIMDTYVKKASSLSSTSKIQGIETEDESNNASISSEKYETFDVSNVRIQLGVNKISNKRIYWEFGNKNLSNRHLLINGNSGCGKTYCIQSLIMEAALQGVSSVIFDYTGGFTNSKLDTNFKEKLKDRIIQKIVRTNKIPINPFSKGKIQIDENLFVSEEDVDIACKIAETFTSVYKFGDLQKSCIYNAVLEGLSKNGNQMDFRKMLQELNCLGRDAKTVVSKIQAFIDMNPFIFDSDFDWGQIRDSKDGIVYIVQLAGYSRDIQMLITEFLLWDVWNFSVRTGDENKPFILVLDEAQNLSHNDKSPSAKILTEGRKFGISGWYATQFMKSQLSDDEIQRLQQASQKLYFCPPDDAVKSVAKNIDITLNGSKHWEERLVKLQKGECVSCGSELNNNKLIKAKPLIISISPIEHR